VECGFVKLNPGEGDVYEPACVVNKTDLPLPQTLDWHSGITFTNLDKSWRTIYARGTNAVVIERQFGHGTVVMAADSYFLSNEAMRKERHADLLAWLVGPNRNVVFDEAHLGVMETSGVAVLMRKYHLIGLAAGLILLAGLFIWKNSASLVPPLTDEKQPPYVAGKDATAGFVNLLRRNIPADKLLETCFTEWKKSAPGSGKYSAPRLQQAEALFKSHHDRNPVQTYREICEVVNKLKKHEH
jgi:hypothetical protein